MRARLTEEEKAGIVDAYKAGVRIRDIMAKYDITPPGIMYWVRKAGVPLRGKVARQAKKASDKAPGTLRKGQRSAAVRLVREGWPVAMVAQRYKVSRQAIYDLMETAQKVNYGRPVSKLPARKVYPHRTPHGLLKLPQPARDGLEGLARHLHLYDEMHQRDDWYQSALIRHIAGCATRPEFVPGLRALAERTEARRAQLSPAPGSWGYRMDYAERDVLRKAAEAAGITAPYAGKQIGNLNGLMTVMGLAYAEDPFSVVAMLALL